MKLEQVFYLACASMVLGETVEAMHGGAPHNYNAAGTRGGAPDARVAFDGDSAPALTYAEAKDAAPDAGAFDRDLTTRRAALVHYLGSNRDDVEGARILERMTPEGYKNTAAKPNNDLAFIYELTRNDAPDSYKIDVAHLPPFIRQREMTTKLAKAFSLFTTERSRARGNERTALVTHVTETDRIMREVNTSIGNLCNDYQNITADPNMDLNQKLINKANRIRQTLGEIQVRVDETNNLGANVAAVGRARKVIAALQSNKVALATLLNTFRMIGLLIVADLSSYGGRGNQLETGLAALYRSCVLLIYQSQISLEGVVHPLSYWYSEEFCYGIDRFLRGLSPSTQLKMYQELDNCTLEQDGFTADQVRNAIPRGALVKPADELHPKGDWVEFGAGYEVSSDGFPLIGGNVNLIPVPPAFRNRNRPIAGAATPPVGAADDAAALAAPRPAAAPLRRAGSGPL
ncbi:MAG: hypothetical protein LBJ96_04335 [Holosporaceae bacterium]|nr:hypothetical protein [Holosporaceae bacterium]